MSADSQAMGRNGVFFWLHGMVLSLLGIFLNYKIQGKSNSLCALVSLSLFFFSLVYTDPSYNSIF